MKLKVYVARAMSGEKKEDVVRRAKEDKAYLEAAGFEVLDPVTAEGVEASNETLLADKSLMDVYWPRDKQMIREAHFVLVMSPDKASLGCIREYGYARYHLWKKVITVFPSGKLPRAGAICYYEDDYVTDSLIDAIGNILQTHATLFKRLNWRLKMYVRSWPKAKWHRLKEWFK